MSMSIWQSLGALQLPVWTQLGYEGSSPNLTDGLESPSCLYGTLMKTGTLCQGRPGQTRRPKGSTEAQQEQDRMGPIVCTGAVPGEAKLGVPEDTEKQISATTGEQRVSRKTQSKVHTKGRPPGSATARHIGCAPWGGGGQGVSSLPALRILGTCWALLGGGDVLVVHGQQTQRRSTSSSYTRCHTLTRNPLFFNTLPDS